MKLQPKYDANIVVAVVYRGEWTWLVTKKEHWFLDYSRWEQSFRVAGKQSPLDGSERYGIRVLDETTIADYLEKASKYVATVVELSERYRHYAQNPDQRNLDEILPSVLVDFDARRLVSAPAEPNGMFEHYVPAGWSGTSDALVDEVPDEQQYWVGGGKDGRRRTIPVGPILRVLTFVEAGVVFVAMGTGIIAQERQLESLKIRCAAVAMMATGTLFMTALIHSAIEHGAVRFGGVGTVTKWSNPRLYWSPFGLIFAVMFGLFVAGLITLVRNL